MRRNTLVCLLVLVAYLMAIFALNCSFHFCSDDCTYGLDWHRVVNGVHPHLGTFYNALLENWRDGYRPLPHLFVRIFTGCLAKWVFNVCNTLIMGLFVILAYRVTFRTFRFEWPRLIALITLIYLILCKGESYMWCSGSLNYLWMATLTLAFWLVREKIDADSLHGVRLWAALPLAFFAGWSQESFVLPLGLAIVMIHLPKIRELTMSKFVFYSVFGAGAVFLIVGCFWRTSQTASFTLTGAVMNFVKITVAAKAVILLVAVALIRKVSRRIFSENKFEFFVIAGSLVLVSFAGFHGERSMLICNLFAIVILLRLVKLPIVICASSGLIMVVVLVNCIILGNRIGTNFEEFVENYLKSRDGVACHERVNCGIFSRFFYQSIYTWAYGSSSLPEGSDIRGFGHGGSFAHYHGRTRIPLALSRELYDGLYCGESFVSPTNKLPIAGDFYTIPKSNTMVMPLGDGDKIPVRFKVRYTYPHGLLSNVKREIQKRECPPVVCGQTPTVLKTSHGSYLLLSKDFGSDKYIAGVDLDYE